MIPIADSFDALGSAAQEPSCPICRSDSIEIWAAANDVEYYTSSESFQYYRCFSCDVLFLHPPPVARLAEIYPSTYYAYVATNPSLVQRIKFFLDRRRLRHILAGIHGCELNVLDVGGGSGQVLDQVRSADARVRLTQVVDLDPGAENIAKAKGHLYARCAIEEFSTSRRFDLILMLNLIEHVQNPVTVLRKAAGMLAPGGKILIKTPNFDSLDARLFRKRSWGGYHCPRHWVLFTAESFKRSAGTAGLRVNRISYTQGAPFWAISIFEALRRRGLVRASAEAPAPFHPIIPVLQGVFAAFDLARLPFSSTSQIFAELSASHEMSH
ncbi:MAG TPA: class I SAM-dependent methyltransferase [Bryobacteraceae bacterium]|nr:class I SAM-dependent methyltransferase [Bryobacteraceae bacterium]